MTGMEHYSNALSQAENQPDGTYNGLCSLADQIIGVKLFTLTVIDNTKREARRVYTNMPEAYPVLGTKPMKDDFWSQKVILHHEIFVANTIEAIAEVFFDHELIQSLGCESVLNIPIVIAGEVLGTINCLHEAGHYSTDRLAASETLKIPGATAFLFNFYNQSQGDH